MKAISLKIRECRLKLKLRGAGYFYQRMRLILFLQRDFVVVRFRLLVYATAFVDFIILCRLLCLCLRYCK